MCLNNQPKIGEHSCTTKQDKFFQAPNPIQNSHYAHHIQTPMFIIQKNITFSEMILAIT